MKFDSIDGSIPQKEQELAASKLHGLALELGVREDNQHVGTGLGGNNGQLFALMSFHHELVNNPDVTIQIDRGLMKWGKQWLNGNGRKSIRHELDNQLPIPKKTSWDEVRQDERFNLGPNVSNWEALAIACNLCDSLSKNLDMGNQSNISGTAMALSGFPQEMILMSVRIYIQIERLVRYDLDEHPDFGKILTSINKAVDN